MAASGPSAVSFTRPPVVEVACGVQFQHLPLDTARVGQFWERFRTDFPQTRDMPALPHVVEHVAGTATAAFRVAVMPDLRRVLFVDPDGGRIVQLQSDRFMFNWHRANPSATYPRYSAVREQFLERWGDLQRFFDDIALPAPSVVQCDLTYINHIPAGQLWSEADVSKVLPWLDSSRLLFEDVELALRTSRDEIDGRLHFVVRTGIDGQAQRMLQLELTARGRPHIDGLNVDVSRWMDDAHRLILNEFVRLTGVEAHLEWGKG